MATETDNSKPNKEKAMKTAKIINAKYAMTCPQCRGGW